ncbi:MAG: hypothetical protein HUK20_08960 [Fibrobacter sp.]|nr:hypothetical protein [Fibrobacter sp.]
MKKILAVLILALAIVSPAQNVKPEFQAFSGALVKLKKAEHGFHKFMLRIEAAPWAFEAQGEVQSPGGDSDLLINGLFDGDVYAVLAYIPSPSVGADGLEYQTGLFDMMLFYEDEPTQIRNLEFKLLPPANDEWAQGILSDAATSSSILGNIWNGKYNKAITRASAVPIDKNKLMAMQRKNKRANDDDGTISPRKRRVSADTEVEQEKPKKVKRKLPKDDDDDTISSRKRRLEDEEKQEETPKKKKKKKKKIEDSDSCDDPSLSIKEKRRCKMKKQ